MAKAKKTAPLKVALKKSHGENSPVRKPNHRGAASRKAKPSKSTQSRESPWSPLFELFGNYLDPEAEITWKKVDCEIKNAAGQVFFKQLAVESPEGWSQLAIEIAASKYFRKRGVPRTRTETSIRQMVKRVSQRIAAAGIEQKYLSKSEAMVFESQLRSLLLQQKGLFNSPVWFNYGLSSAYGIHSEGICWAWNAKKKRIEQSAEVFKHPQVSACFIQKVEDSLDSIFDLAKNEARLFKFGSGSGTNFSSIRSKYEILSGGGVSSGVITFLEVLDRGAGSVKSGGTSRRAAKMVILDIDHPEIEEFIDWKVREEAKARVLMQAGYGTDYESESFRTVSGQNANNSVRVTDAFLQAVETGKDWDLKARKSRTTLKTVSAQALWKKMAEAAWACADPGVQFHDTINAWHTCANTASILASNPCSEYMFLEDSACNLASLNLLKFLSPEGMFDLSGFLHAIRIFFMAQEILVDDASYPTENIAANSHKFRPLGLGYAGLGAFLMQKAIPYDSDEGRAWAASLAAILTGAAYEWSARMSKQMGPFEGFAENRRPMLKVIGQHLRSLDFVHWNLLPADFEQNAREVWANARTLGRKYGYRNSQASVIAPTGTIGLVMDSETTGIEPEFSLLKRKKLSGGGELRILSQAFLRALEKLDYAPSLIEEIRLFVDLNGGLVGCPLIKDEHKSILATAMEISPEGHLKMMAALQPFVSGAISKTVNMPAESTAQDIADLYWQAWQLGLKSVAIYRDGSKGSQPLEVMKKKDALSQDPIPQDLLSPEAGKPVGKLIPENLFPKCFNCGNPTELAGGCFRCTNCGTVIGCA